ncbi:hypothetical protein NDU88_002403 [Pleurodeles waltl]|uniref:Uncharacterized protein n=1 Tax=Pleurodeles waltl TaxID=8319 RepID=A0AAV7M5W2_PLEWA|nr:hypothetical protein NDU88_002403 [Pleurodeles waltl]
MAEDASFKGMPVDLELLRGWSQWASCLLGNANAGLIAERRRAILMRINPKLGYLANKEIPGAPKGIPFGEGFTKTLGKYSSMFTAFSTAQSNMRQMFTNRVLEGLKRGVWLSAVGYQGPNITIRTSWDSEEVSVQATVSSRKEIELLAHETTGVDSTELEIKMQYRSNVPKWRLADYERKGREQASQRCLKKIKNKNGMDGNRNI